MESTTKLYSLNYTNANTYLFAFVFIVGNVVLPQLCHLVHLGGPAMLPIYFCLLYTSDAADEEDSVDLGGRRIIKKKT